MRDLRLYTRKMRSDGDTYFTEILRRDPTGRGFYVEFGSAEGDYCAAEIVWMSPSNWREDNEETLSNMLTALMKLGYEIFDLDCRTFHRM